MSIMDDYLKYKNAAKTEELQGAALAAINRSRETMRTGGVQENVLEPGQAGELNVPLDFSQMQTTPAPELSGVEAARMHGLDPTGQFAEVPQAQEFFKEQQTAEATAEAEQQELQEVQDKTIVNYQLADQMEKDFPAMAASLRAFSTQRNWDSAEKVVGQWYVASQRMKEQQKKDEQRMRELMAREQGRPSGGGIDPLKTFKAEQSLRKEFEANPKVKDFHTIDSQMDKLNEVWGGYIAGSQDARSMIGVDQALIMIFNKLLDPGSVVRESEFARTPQASGVFERAAGILPKLQRGGVGLTNKERQEIVNTANILHKAAQDGYQKYQTGFQSTVSQYPELGIQSQRVFPSQQPTTAPARATTPAPAPAATQQGPSPEDQEAMQWLQANPNHPKAQGVRQKLQSKGLL